MCVRENTTQGRTEPIKTYMVAEVESVYSVSRVGHSTVDELKYPVTRDRHVNTVLVSGHARTCLCLAVFA